MKPQQFIKDYLSFTRKERIGLLALVAVIIFVILFPGISGRQRGKFEVSADSSWMSAMKKLEWKDSQTNDDPVFRRESNANDYAYHIDQSAGSSPLTATYFNFDPNELDESGWRKLGLKPKTIQTIQKYLSKGGHFYKPEDLKRIYGLRPDHYARLEPYIKIGTSEVEKQDAGFSYEKPERRKAAPRIIDINTSDTSGWISLPGIGSKLAMRIVNFREKLGGFYDIGQLSEIYGLNDSTFQKIRPYLKLEGTTVKTININSATIDELKAHPYIRYNLANPIVTYRKEHGLFSDLNDIKKVMAVTDEVYKKIAPYLTLQ